MIKDLAKNINKWLKKEMDKLSAIKSKTPDYKIGDKYDLDTAQTSLSNAKIQIELVFRNGWPDLMGETLE
jgi:hypothetical protein